MISPFKISEKAQAERNKQRSDDFFKDYKELCKKHGLEHRAELHATPTALISILTLVQYEPKKEESKIIKHG